MEKSKTHELLDELVERKGTAWAILVRFTAGQRALISMADKNGAPDSFMEAMMDHASVCVDEWVKLHYPEADEKLTDALFADADKVYDLGMAEVNTGYIHQERPDQVS